MFSGVVSHVEKGQILHSPIFGKNVILELIIVQNVQRPLIGTTKIVDWDELFEFYQQ